MSARDAGTPAVRPVQLFAEVLLVGVLVCVASLPVVTALGAAGAGSVLVRELVDEDRTPRVRRFGALLRAGSREPLALVAPVVFLGVAALDVLALLGGLPGGGVLGPLIGLGLAFALVCGARGAARWRPGLAWRDVLADAADGAVADWAGSLMLVAALAVVVLVAVQVPAFVTVLPGLLVMAAVAVERRLAAR